MTALRLALQPSDPTLDHNGQLGSVMYHHRSVPFSLPAKWEMLFVLITFWGFPDGTSGKESTYRCSRCKGRGFNPWLGISLGGRKWQPTPVFLPGKFHGQEELGGLQSMASQSQTGLSTHVHRVPCTMPTVVNKTETVPAQRRAWPSRRDRHEIYVIMRQFCLI